MKRVIEKAAVLSLSLMLVSTFSVSSALPKMMEYFVDYSQAQVELLLSVTSVAVMGMILLNTWLSGYVSERVSIISGLVLLAGSGITPVFCQRYGVFLLSRIFLGVGIGLINARAINMINERYAGEERAMLLGFRGSAEVMGNAVLTFAAGHLLLIRWNYAFLIYLMAVPILLLYMLFIPSKAAGKKVVPGSGQKFSIGGHWRFVLVNAGLAWLFICINCSNTMRIPGLVLEKGYGTATDASTVLSLMLLTGMVSGFLFGILQHLLKEKLMPVAMLISGAGLLIIVRADSLAVLAVGAVLAGFAYSILTTCVFHRISVALPSDAVNPATSVILIGCNLGAASSTLVLNLISVFSEAAEIPFLFYAVLLMGLVLYRKL